jgi:hypothetical protein
MLLFSLCILLEIIHWSSSFVASTLFRSPVSCITTQHCSDKFRDNLTLTFNVFYVLLFYCWAGWGYILTFTKVIIMYQIHHTWIHPLTYCFYEFVISAELRSDYQVELWLLSKYFIAERTLWCFRHMNKNEGFATFSGSTEEMITQKRWEEVLYSHYRCGTLGNVFFERSSMCMAWILMSREKK